jgi:xylulokinase
MATIAGFDSSTQSCKLVVRDLDDGAVVRTGRAPHPAGTEVHPDAWWDALLAAVADAGGLDGVQALAVGGQQHGMVVLDEGGNVLRPALLWNDTRSASAAAALIDEFGAAGMAERTGSVPVASFTATKLRWLRDAEPGIAERVAAVCLPHDWLTWRLRGFGPDHPDLDALVTDRSDASGTSYFDPIANAYDRELLVAALGHDAVLPRVAGPWDRIGTTAAHPGIPTGIVVAPGMGDNAGAALGVGAGVGDAIVSIGTSGTVFAVTDTPVVDPSGTVAGFADASGASLPLIATLNAARVLGTVADLLEVDHDAFAALAMSAAPGAGGVVLTPYFEGERTPNLPDATATFSGLTIATTTRANIARAAVEGMLCGLADGLDAIRSRGVDVERIVMVGGATQNPAVAETATQVFDRPIRMPEPGEYVATGAAVQAAHALTGEHPTWSVPAGRDLAPAPVPAIRAQYRAARPDVA